MCWISGACILASGLSLLALAQSSDHPKPPAQDDCAHISRLAVAQVASGESGEGHENAARILTQAVSRGEDACAGLVLTNVAAFLLASGRLAESERLAERAVHVLEKKYSRDDPALLRALHTLCSARLAQGKVGPARNSFKRIQRVPIELPEDRLLLHSVAAPLLASQGQYADAESEYLAALKVLEQSDRLQTVSAATMLQGLAFVHIRQQRFEDARQEIDRAAAIFQANKETVAADQVKIFRDRSGRWAVL